MKLNHFVAVFIAVFLSCSVFAKEDVPDSIEGVTKVTAEEVIGLIEESEELVIIDARSPADRAAGYIEGSVALPNTDTTAENFAAAVASKDTPVVIYCNGVKCGRSVESSKNAVAWGYTKVYWFRGGWEEWSNEGLPATTD